VLTLIVALPAARVFFGLGPVGAGALALVALAAVLLFGVLELAQRPWRRWLES
jgi:hypothetical protein